MSFKNKVFPEYVMVGHRKIKVKLDSKMDDHGLYDSDKSTISLNPKGHSPDSSLLHELVHAALDVSGVGTIINNENLEEAICVALECLHVNFDFKVKEKKK